MAVWSFLQPSKKFVSPQGQSQSSPKPTPVVTPAVNYSSFQSRTPAVLGAQTSNVPYDYGTAKSYDYSTAKSTAAPYIPTPPTGGGNTGSPMNTQPAGQDTLRNDISNQLDTGMSNLDREYEAFLSQLNGQESDLNRQAQLGGQQIESAFNPAKTALQQEQNSKLGVLDTQQNQTQQQEKSALQQARDLYRQVQQQNIAQLSGLGLSSSSVSEALAENLGVDTARRIASVSQNANDVYNGIQKERKNINDYVTSKISELEQEKSNRLAELQNNLLTGLNQINQARNAAAADKANRRADLLQQAQSAAAQLQAQSQQFAQSLQQWQAQNDQKLSAAASKDYSGAFGNTLQQLPGITSMLPQGYGASFNLDLPGGGKVNISPQKKDKEDPLAALFAQSGLDPSLIQ